MSAISRQFPAIWILVLGPLLAVSGQTLAPLHRLPLNEPLEKYNMPPAAPRKIETSPRMISQFGVFASHQVNVDGNGNNILGDAANEPSISVDPTDGSKMVIAWRQFNSINSTSDRLVGVTRPTLGYTGRSLALLKITSFAATL